MRYAPIDIAWFSSPKDKAVPRLPLDCLDRLMKINGFEAGRESYCLILARLRIL